MGKTYSETTLCVIIPLIFYFMDFQFQVAGDEDKSKPDYMAFIPSQPKMLFKFIQRLDREIKINPKYPRVP
jgi:hypothetical protein